MKNIWSADGMGNLWQFGHVPLYTDKTPTTVLKKRVPPAQSTYVCSASPLDTVLTKRYSRDIAPSPKKHKTQRVTFGDLVLPSGHN